MHTVGVGAGLDGLDGAFGNTVTTGIARRCVLGLDTTLGQILPEIKTALFAGAIAAEEPGVTLTRQRDAGVEVDQRGSRVALMAQREAKFLPGIIIND